MRKLINNANEFVDEATEGILMAHPRSLRWAAENRRAVVRASAGTDGKVGIVTGGGSGHLPLFLGYVGEGLASGVAIGNVFSSPSPEAIYAATKASDTGRGVLYLYGNYGGDIYNFDIAAEMAAADGIDTTTVRGHDDILSASETDAEKRRGVAGLFFLYKVSGAAADAGYDLATVKRLTLRASKNTATVGVGLSPTILPAAGEPTFHLEDGQMEIGIGIHGEKGRYKGELRSADSITEELLSELVDGLALVEADEVAILVNGLGATPLEELYIMYRKASAMLHERSINLSRVYVGNFATSLEMTGASISLLKLDHELRDLLDTPASSPFFRQTEPPVCEAMPISAPTSALSAQDEEPREATSEIKPGDFRSTAIIVLSKLTHHSEELRELDASIGDGDLGVTISEGVKSAVQSIKSLPADADVSEVLRAIGVGFAAGNPSTFAALVGGGIASASLTMKDQAELGQAEWLKIIKATLDSVQRRGKATTGDKTIVDPLSSMVQYLERSIPDATITGLLEVVRSTVEQSAQWRSLQGRANWAGDRSIGVPDPGSVAILRFIEGVNDYLA